MYLSNRRKSEFRYLAWEVYQLSTNVAFSVELENVRWKQMLGVSDEVFVCRLIFSIAQDSVHSLFCTQQYDSLCPLDVVEITPLRLLLVAVP
jgi:hypothetical protein